MQLPGPRETRNDLREVNTRRLRHGCGVLHGAGSSFRAAAGEMFGTDQMATRASDSSGSMLVELLIAMSVMTIGVLAVSAGGRSVRIQAELASRRAAEALAAQQVLEHGVVGAPGGPPRTDTVSIGIHEVRVQIESRDSMPGLVRLRVEADADAGGVPWEVETLRAIR